MPILNNANSTTNTYNNTNTNTNANGNISTLKVGSRTSLVISPAIT